MFVSIANSPGLTYPDSRDGFSPSERFPEYRFDHVASRPNPVYPLVRQVLAQAGLDAENFGAPAWNPLGRFVAPGSRVFVLCNFVYHRRRQESDSDFAAKCIHGSVLRALCDYLLLAVGPGGTVHFGNSPLQSCDWNRVLSETGAASVVEFYARRGAPVAARDLRLFVSERNVLGRVTAEGTRDGSEIEVGLGPESLLRPVAWRGTQRARFRISDYRPERIASFHSGDRHRYVINREVLDSSVVVSLSKLKTHEKVGMTCGLKGFVGMVGHKDCLAHHRFGNPSAGGDEYPERQAFLRPFSVFQDWVQGRARDASFQGPLQVLDRNLRRALYRLGADMGGAWWGNDTCWRMALDLARIAHFADASGTMCEVPQRRHLSLIDGIVGGEGQGPLSARPVTAGTLVFSDEVAWADRAACKLMGFSPEAIPLVRGAFQPMHFPVAGAKEPVLVRNGQPGRIDDLEPVLGRPFRPPRGWRGRVTGR